MLDFSIKAIPAGRAVPAERSFFHGNERNGTNDFDKT